MGRVAIIAVHGVGSPPRLETARAVADLLAQHASSSTVRYAGFTEQLITVPTDPLQVPPVTGDRAAGDGAAAFAPEFKKRLKSLSPGDRDRTYFGLGDEFARDDPDVAFMRDQLAGYEGASERPPYNTVEIIGSRVDRAKPTTRTDVHIYEMHWADLSRVGDGLIRVTGALYQIVLHMGHLGRKALDVAASVAAQEAVGGKETTLPERVATAHAWRRLATAHAWVLRIFTVGVPVSTLLLFSCLTLFLPAAVAPNRRLVVGTIIIEVAALIVLGLVSYFRRNARNTAGQFVTSIIVAAVAGIACNVFAAQLGGDQLGIWVLGTTIAVLVLVAYSALINRYDHSAPGALPWGVIGGVIVLIGMFIQGRRFIGIAGAGAGEGLRFVALAGVEFSYVILMLAWLFIWAAAVVTLFHGWRLRRALRRTSSNRNETLDRANRAVWTAKVTLAVSLFGLLITGLVGYQALIVLAWRAHASFNVFPPTIAGRSFPLIAQALVPPRTTCPAIDPRAPYDSAACARHFVEAAIAQSGTVGLPVAFFAAAVSLLLVSWFVALVAATSIHRPKSPAKYAENLGCWMTDGFRWMRRAGSVLVFGLAVALAIGFIVAVWTVITGEEPSQLRLLTVAGTARLLMWLAVAVIATSATLAAARARLELLAARARPALGIILDVDNYLRESPHDRTPKARIAERFTSLLHHIVDRKDSAGARYFDRVVILAHSQGTVISADLLRFLTIAGVAHPDLSDVDVRLMTMGSPLRQLYAVNFPQLYRWVDRTDDFGDGGTLDEDARFAPRGPNGAVLLDRHPKAAQGLSGLSPSPLSLRVTRWVNLYTSGDYVGRCLWQTDRSEGVWRYHSYDEAKLGLRRRERCLGDGTHTHYWTSPDVARELDDLIA